MRFFFCYCIEKDYLCKNFQAKILKTYVPSQVHVRDFVGYFIVAQYVKLIIITMKKFLLSIFCCLMAVFAVQAETVTYTVTSTSVVSVSGDAPSGSSATYNSTYATKCQLTGGNSMTLTLSGYAGYKITGITLSMKSNTSKGAGNFSLVAGETTISSIATANFNTANWNGAWSTSYVDVKPTMANNNYAIANGEDVVIKIAATVNSLYCQSFTIEYESAGDVAPTAKKPTFSQESCEFNLDEPFEVTISAVEDGATIYYTTDGNDPTEVSARYSTPIQITETTTLKAIAVVDGYNNSAVAEATYIAIDPNAVAFEIIAEEQGYETGEVVETLTFGDVTATLAKGSNNNNAPKYYDNGLAIRAYGGNTITFTCATNVVINKIEFTFSNGEDSNEITADCGTYSEGVWYGSSNNVVFTIGGTSGNRRFAAIKVTYAEKPYTLTVTNAGWATLFLADDVIIPDGVICYTVSSFSGNYVLLEEITTDVLPSETAAIVEATEGDYLFESNGEKTAYAGTNYLKGTAANEYITEEAYVLSVVDGEVGLYKAEMTDGTWLNNANKAYLPASSVPNKTVEFYGFDWGGTTGIENIEGVAGNNFGEGAIYDLTGRKINSIAVTGIYIIDGKKVFIRK